MSSFFYTHINILLSLLLSILYLILELIFFLQPHVLMA